MIGFGVYCLFLQFEMGAALQRLFLTRIFFQVAIAALVIAAMKNDEKDRHVVAAAVKAGAQVIVTSNLKHFRELPEGIEAQSPDEFLCNVFDLDPDGMAELVREQAAALKKPKRSYKELLDGLSKFVPEFVAALRVRMK